VEVSDLKPSTRGDIAAAGIGYALGFFVDNFYFPGGLTGGVVAAVSATGAVGLKNLFHAFWANRKMPAIDYSDDPNQIKEQAEKLLLYITTIVDRSENPKEHPLRPGLEQYERMLLYWRNGVIGDQEFYVTAFVPARAAFRAHLDKVRYVWTG
jgi:hypothetical protein